MTEFLAALVVFGLAFAGLSLGVLLRGVRLKGSCGGMNNLRKVMGFNPCDACTDPSPDCPLRGQSTTTSDGRTQMSLEYGFGTTVPRSFDDAIERVTEALKVEGFGVLSEIDVAAKMKDKLDIDMPPYRILGACNPALAHRAIEAEPSIGLLLPCNVVVREDDAGTVHVEFMDPHAVLQLVKQPAVDELAGEVRQRLERVMAAL